MVTLSGDRPISVRDARLADVPAIAEIYDEQVRTSVATFETRERGAELFSAAVADDGVARVLLVACDGEQVVGFASSGPFRPRPAYAATAEVSVYLAEGARGRGIGRALYVELLRRLDAAGIHTEIAVVALPNPASEALHRAMGFERVGVLREVGHKLGRYVDTAWYQRLVLRE